MIPRSAIETAYCLLHQKLRVFQYSNLPWQRDDIEYVVGNFVADINPDLYAHISRGRFDFLLCHDSFESDMQSAVESLESLLSEH